MAVSSLRVVMAVFSLHAAGFSGKDSVVGLNNGLALTPPSKLAKCNCGSRIHRASYV